MKSLAYAYAQYISAETGADEMDVFGDIVDGGVDIPKWFINEWLSANPIFASEDSEDYEVIMTNIGHSMERDGRVQVFGDVVFGLPNDRRSRISSFGTGADKAEARQALIDRATGYLIEEEQLHDYMTRNHLESEEFNAETKSWRFQKRDSSGKFTKGFVEEVEISELPENLPMKEVSLPVIFEEQDVLDFINGAIADDNFPERLSDPKFIQLCSDVAASAPMSLLKHLNVVANIRQLENLMSGSEEETVAAGRAIFVTDFMLNFKEGQDYWAAEEE
tara:strand:- start:514 stop:1344 length:831 start_codon:yes stop_codon:yes gene_type:complete